MSDETEDTITETPTGEVAVVPGEGNIPTIVPQVERTFPIRNIKLLSDAKVAQTNFLEFQYAKSQQALLLFDIIASAAALEAKRVEAEIEKDRLLHRIVADTAGRVKDEDVFRFDLGRAVIVLKPQETPEAPKLVLPGQ